ncbi:ankyrin repeat domain-containing protein 63 [Astyanax mexicanus]|uniref:ankyrin repeat domain-containing protein 63 n=1 Tax=Astyanax mexicanus TaxID=7994 RepID=UPI0020CAD7BF|nr:ankyrin repeat domain-containing protein 63 [Astyanax mexicanus]
MLRPKDLCQGSGTKTFLDAMNSGKVHLARFVLDALDGRIINSKTESSRTPLMYAVSLQDPGTRSKFTHLLLEKGADVNSRDEHGRTALSLACELGHLDAVKILVQFNADPEVTDTWGNSALMYAAYGGHNQILEFLMRAFKRFGLKLDHTNQAGHSAVQVAEYLGHTQCVQVLNGAGKKGTGSAEQMEEKDGELQGGERGETRQPNRLPKQILDRFSNKLHSKNEEPALPALFQKQLWVGSGGGGSCGGGGGGSCGGGNHERRRFSQQHSPDRTHSTYYQSLSRFSERRFTADDQQALFTSKQIQNSAQRETSGTTTRKLQLNYNSERCHSGQVGEKEDTRENIPMWGKAKSFNLDLRTGRKQSYQGDLRDPSLSTSKLKRASLQDEKALVSRFPCHSSATSKIPYSEKVTKTPTELRNAEEERDSKQQSSVCKAARHNKLLLGREEMAIERIKARPQSIGGLGTRLLRRFTAPEFMRLVRDCPSGTGLSKGKIARSETFPLSHGHKMVNSQPSVDSISAVRCEFEGSPPVCRS